MSSLFKGVRKLFKKVLKVVKKLAPIILGVAAIVFTGGAALGLAGMAGGWGAAAATVGTTIGGSGLLGTVLTGAITQAGTGALIGGAIAAATGGPISKGMMRGAAAGAVTGGVMGGVGHVRNASGVEGYGPITEGSVTTTPLPETAGVNYGAGTGQAVDAAGNVIPPTGGGGRGLLRGVGSFIKDNPEIAGGIITGIGQGLLSGSEADAEKDLLRARHRLISSKYEGSDPGATYRGLAPGTSGQSPTERFDPRSYGSFEYQYDPKAGRIVKVPAGQGQ